MKKLYLRTFLLFSVFSLDLNVHSLSDPDTASMHALKASLGNLTSLDWSSSEPCVDWRGVICDNNNRVTEIQIRSRQLRGRLPPDLNKLSSLTILDVSNNQLTGPIPSLAGLRSLLVVHLDDNDFSYMPSDFFAGMRSLYLVSLDNNPLSSWEIPESLKDATHLEKFSANQASVSGIIPNFLGGDTFPRLLDLHLAMNNLEGEIPLSFSQSSIQTLWLNGQQSDSKLNGSIAVIENMKSLTELRLHDNRFTGPLPDISGLSRLEELNLGDNLLTGIVTSSLVNHPKLRTVSLTNNLFQGPTPHFDNPKVNVDMRSGSNSFCLDDPGVACDSWVNILLSIVESLGYPMIFAKTWQGNDPCNNSRRWTGIRCTEGKITVVDFQNLGLSGTISSNFSKLSSLKLLKLTNNSLRGTIPNELANLPSLEVLDVSNNHLYCKVPKFRPTVSVYTYGNPDIGKDNCSFSSDRAKNSNAGKIVGSVTGAVCGVFIFLLGVYLCTRKRNRSCWLQRGKTAVINPPDEMNANALKVVGSGWSLNRDEFGNMFSSIQVLRNVTNNFSEENRLGRGGFGSVYKGEFHDGKKIAVKRMESGVVSKQGLAEFKSEIKVLTQVRHRHLVALLGYCFDRNEKLLVYEYMPQGTLSRYLFNWMENGLKPLEWTRRLTIALDVARGIEYLHGLAHQRFIHRDLKPSNILLGDNMRAKVADFGLVRLIPENIKQSIQTRVAGTFGYLAPEYVVTGRVTSKVDVFSFGVILMELITGRKAVDATDPEDVIHLVTWFRKMYINKDTCQEAIDQTIELDEETLASVSTVAELADYCCATKPRKRPGMDYVVHVLSSLAELWKPTNPIYDDINDNDLDIPLPPKSHSSGPESLMPLATMEVPHYYSL